MQYLEWDADGDDFTLMKSYLNDPDSKKVLKWINSAAKEISCLTIKEIWKKIHISTLFSKLPKFLWRQLTKQTSYNRYRSQIWYFGWWKHRSIVQGRICSFNYCCELGEEKALMLEADLQILLDLVKIIWQVYVIMTWRWASHIVTLSPVILAQTRWMEIE